MTLNHHTEFLQPFATAFVYQVRLYFSHVPNTTDAGAGDFQLARHGAFLFYKGGHLPQVLETTEAGAGGFKLASAAVAGRGGVYGRLKFESGIHRVQRVPATESSGRVHTSAASVAVMPQATEVRGWSQRVWHLPKLRYFSTKELTI